MATASPFPRESKPQPNAGAVSLEALPMPAAIAGPNGLIRAANRLWNRACERYSGSAKLQAAIREVMEAKAPVIAELEGPARITVTPCASGALLVCDAPDAVQSLHAEKVESVGRLVGGVVHDFANLLTLIGGYSQMVLNRLGENDPVRAEVDEIRKAAGRGSQLTAQLLGFTRGQSVKRGPVDLNAVIREMQGMLRPVIGENIELLTDLAPGLGKVIADTGQMEQVIMNLVLNARDAILTGGTIEIRTSHTELIAEAASARGMEPGPSVVLAVRDTGHGMDAHVLEHLWDPFFTTKDKGSGTGLGLHTVRNIVGQSRGSVSVKSAPGEGTTFTIHLPLAPEALAVRTSAGLFAEMAKGSETVLVVEDEEGVRRLLTQVLNRCGYRVLEASNGEEALAIYSQHSPEIHLVLTDVIMPKMGGFDLAARVQQIQPGARLMFMSGYTDDVLARTGGLTPGMVFLQKPLRPDVLAARVRETLDAPARPFNPR